MPIPAKNAEVSVEVLQQLLHLDISSGHLFWNNRTAKWFTASGKLTAEQWSKVWNTRWAGKRALCLVKPNGYFYGPVLGRKMYAHRVVFALYNGFLPGTYVDHIDGNVKNNNPVNLREATPSQNMRNMGAHKRNTSGYNGVSWSVHMNKWRASFRANQKTIHVGYFNEIEKAAAALHDARRAHGFSYRHGDPIAQSFQTIPENVQG